jgi:hypothetical protein
MPIKQVTLAEWDALGLPRETSVISGVPARKPATPAAAPLVLRQGQALKLTPALRRIPQFIADGGPDARMLLQVIATGGRASSQFQALRNAGYVSIDQPDRVGVTTAGRKALE